MGEHSYCFATMVAKGTKIGKYCSIASGVWIHPAEHDIYGVSTSPNVPGHIYSDTHGNSKKGRDIGNDVWIGLNAIILQSCDSVGHGAIIGGVPARIIKYRFPADMRNRLLKSKWWGLPDETLAKLPTDNAERFLKKIKGKRNEII